MSVKTVKKVRDGRIFRPADLLIYGVLAIIIVALFVAFVFTRASAPLSEIYADMDGQRVLVWSVNDEKLVVEKQWQDRVTTTTGGDAVTVRIFADDEKTRYNDVEFSARGAKVTAANCSAHKDCVFSAAITDASDVIICVPHKLKLYSSGERNPSLG